MSLPATIGHQINNTRIAKMAMLRNVYIDRIEELQFPKETNSLREVPKETNSHREFPSGINSLREFPSSSQSEQEWDYVIMWDLDIIGSTYVDGIATSFYEFEANPAIDAICANGIYSHGFSDFYYDTYAHEEMGKNNNKKDKWLHDINMLLWTGRYKRGEPLYRCRSCFGGFTIYKLSSCIQESSEGEDIKLKRYIPPGDALECEHVLFNRQFKEVYVNPSMINLLVENV